MDSRIEKAVELLSTAKAQYVAAKREEDELRENLQSAAQRTSELRDEYMQAVDRVKQAA